MALRRRHSTIDYTYSNGFRTGNAVIVTASDIFKGEAIGFVVSPAKWCPLGITVYIPDEENSRYLCIQIERGHTIVKATKE